MEHKPDPNRLHLRKLSGSTTYLIVYRQRIIGQVDSLPQVTGTGIENPPILLEQPFSEQLCDRIRDLVNKRDGTNRDIRVMSAPRWDHPAIVKHLQKRLLSW